MALFEKFRILYLHFGNVTGKMKLMKQFYCEWSQCIGGTEKHFCIFGCMAAGFSGGYGILLLSIIYWTGR